MISNLKRGVLRAREKMRPKRTQQLSLAQRVPACATAKHSSRWELFVACLLALCLMLACPIVPAAADEAEDAVAAAEAAVDEAQGTLASAEARVAEITSEYDALRAEAEALQQRIDETSAQAMEAQAAVLAGREALGRTAQFQYRDDTSTTSLFITLMFDTQDFGGLLQNLAYLESIMRHQNETIAQQKARTDEYAALLDELNAQKDEQAETLAAMEEKKAEAEQLVAGASANLQTAQADQAERIAELARRAEEAEAAGRLSEPVAVEEASTVERADAVSSGTPVQGNPDSSNAGGSWSTGVASAYGGSSDPYTPNPGTTATGAVCDDNSMGVAVPMSWSRYWQYYGRTVEISYNGMTVLATVNDCGYMGGGSRSLDLQPGVWKAFGYSSCTDWGVRTVNYRFL